MAKSLGTLNLDLVARIGGFTGPLKNASSSAKREMKQISSSVQTAATAITAVTAAATAAAAGVVAFTNSAAQNARELRTQAQLANASVGEFQRMAYATNTVGVEQDKLADILKDTNDRVGDFIQTGGGEMAQFFENVAPLVGVTADHFARLSGPEALQLYYESLERAGLTQQEMTFYMESMADEATALIPLLRDGGTRFAEMADEADRLGIVLNEMEIARLEEFAQQFDRLSSILSSMGNIIASELAPYLSVMADEIVEAAGGAEGLRDALPEAIHNSVAAIGPLLNGLHMARIAVEGLQATASSIGQAYSFAFLSIQENATKMLDFVAGGINEIIEGFNNLPGLEIPLIDSFNSSEYMGALREGYAEISQLAEEQRDQVAELWDAPLPSQAIDDFLADVETKVAEFRDKQEAVGGIFSGDGGGIIDPEAARESAKEAERLLAAYESLYDKLRPVEASQKQYAIEESLIRAHAPAEELNRLLDELDEHYRNAENAAEVYGFTGKAAMDEVNDAAQDLGFAFESAFENAVIGGEGLRDVLSGILEDISRIVLRQNVTKPLGKAISGLDWGDMFGFAAGGYTGPGNKMDPAGIVHAGEFVVQKSVVEKPGVRPMLERLNKGYANGGYVGNMPSLSGGGGGTNVYITTPPGTEARTEERQNAQGGRDLHVIIDEVTAANMNNPGSRTGRAMQQKFGAQRTLTGR